MFPVFSADDRSDDRSFDCPVLLQKHEVWDNFQLKLDFGISSARVSLSRLRQAINGT